MSWLLLAILLGVAFWTDARRSVIPNWLTFGGAVTGVIVNGIYDGTEGLLGAAVGLGTGFGVMLVLHVCGALGAGDVKLFAAIGALSGVRFALVCSFYSLFAAGVIALIVLAVNGRLVALANRIAYVFIGLVYLKQLAWFRPSERSGLLRFPFMYAVLPGAMIAGYETFLLSKGG